MGVLGERREGESQMGVFLRTALAGDGPWLRSPRAGLSDCSGGHPGFGWGMRKWVRRSLKLAMMAVVGLLVLACVTLTTVDRRPLAGRIPLPESGRTTANAEAPAAVEVRAGFGRAKLTPRIGAAADRPEAGEFRMLPLAGYGNRGGRPAVGVHDDLWVKAVAVAAGSVTGVVVAADALIIPREVSEDAVTRIRARCGLDRQFVYFGATHTHCSLGGWGEGVVGEAFAGGFQPGVRVWMAHQLAEAVVAAVSNLTPATVAGASFEAPEGVRNRLVGDQGRIDPEFSLLCLRQVHGDAAGGTAVIGSYSAHATVMGGGTMEFSGDYPGFWQRAVEAGTGGMAMFLAGGVGSHAPKPPKGGWEGARLLGEGLAARTLETLKGVPATNRVAFGLQTAFLELPELQARLTDGIRLRPWVARRLLPVRETTWLQVFRVGDRAWFSTPCDYSGEMALDLKAAARGRGLHAVVTSFNGDYVGYVVPEKYYGMATYETRTMSFFGPQLPGYFAGVLDGMLGSLGASAASR